MTTPRKGLGAPSGAKPRRSVEALTCMCKNVLCFFQYDCCRFLLVTLAQCRGARWKLTSFFWHTWSMADWRAIGGSVRRIQHHRLDITHHVTSDLSKSSNRRPRRISRMQLCRADPL